MKIKIEFNKHDIWMGVYWHIQRDMLYRPYLDIYICVIPMLPIRITIPLPRM